MQPVIDRLIVELAKPRPLTAQVLKHLAGAYGVERDVAGAFLDQRLATLEDDELDLALSSLFTPKLADQAIFADLLAGLAVPPSVWPTWVEALVQRPTDGCLVTEDGLSHRFPLRAVTIERYLNRLRLDGSVPADLLKLIQTLSSAEDRSWLLAVARRAIWNTPDRQDILRRFFSAIPAEDPYRLTDAEALLMLVESTEPASAEDLCARLPEWERTVRSQLNAAEMPRPFFNQQVQEMHGGGRDRRSADNPTRARKQAELEFLSRLQARFCD